MGLEKLFKVKKVLCLIKLKGLHLVNFAPCLQLVSITILDSILGKIISFGKKNCGVNLI